MLLPVIKERKVGVLTFGKCGSSSIRGAFAKRYFDEPNGRSGLEVCSCALYYLGRALAASEAKDYDFIAVVRHPVHRFVSAYNQLRYWDRDFDAFFAKAIISEDYHVVPVTSTLTRHHYFRLGLKIRAVDLNDTAEIEKTLGFKIPHENKMASKGWSDKLLKVEDLTDEQILAIEEAYADDMVFGNYKSLVK